MSNGLKLGKTKNRQQEICLLEANFSANISRVYSLNTFFHWERNSHFFWVNHVTDFQESSHIFKTFEYRITTWMNWCKITFVSWNNLLDTCFTRLINCFKVFHRVSTFIDAAGTYIDSSQLVLACANSCGDDDLV